MKTLLFAAVSIFCLAEASAQVTQNRPISSTISNKPLIKTLKHKSTASFGQVIDISKEFAAKYNFDAWISEDQVLHFETNAKVSEAKLQVFTPEQLAVRKGVMHEYPFPNPVNSYQFKLTAPAFANNYGYWLYITTTDGLKAEAYFQRRK